MDGRMRQGRQKENNKGGRPFRNGKPEARKSAEDEARFEGQLEGRNVVLEAMRGGRTIDKLFVQEGITGGPIDTVLKEANRAKVPVTFLDKAKLDAMSATGHHQGVIAKAAAYEYSTVDEMLKEASERGEDPFIILLDGIEDPHNLGAIIRSAACAGAHGVVIPKHRASGLTPTAVRASAGAVDRVKVAKVTNIADEIEKLKERGIWAYCADMGGASMYDMDLKGPLALVIGAEGKGVGKRILGVSDGAVSIPMMRDFDSLNASVAAGVLMYEAVRQRAK